MNYISHYYFDRKDNNDYYNFGLILPDLMSFYKRGWKIRQHNLNEDISARNMMIISGVLQHYRRDAAFHGSEYFFKYTGVIKDLIKQNKIPYQYLGIHFISHIILELTLDKLVIKKTPAILEEFYDNLVQIEEDHIISLFNDVTVQFREGFFEFFEKFKEGKYFYRYKENKTIIEVLNRVLQKVSLPAFEEPDELAGLDRCIDLLENILLENFHELNSLILFDLE